MRKQKNMVTITGKGCNKMFVNVIGDNFFFFLNTHRQTLSVLNCHISLSCEYKRWVALYMECDLVSPSSKALGWQAEGPRFDPLQLSFLFKNCGLWTLSCDFTHTTNKTLKWFTQLPTLMQSFWWWQCSMLL